MTLEKGRNAYAEKYGRDEEDKQRLMDAYTEGYLQAVDNWVKKARD